MSLYASFSSRSNAARVPSSIRGPSIAATMADRHAVVNLHGSGGSLRPRALPLAQNGNRVILAAKPTRQGVDLGLTLGRERLQLGAIALEEGFRVRRLALPIGSSFRRQFRDLPGHAANDLPVDQVKLPLGLAAGFLDQAKPALDIVRGGHLSFPCQLTKLDGPS